MRSGFLRRCTFEKTQRAYYTPLYLLLIPTVFWVTITGLQDMDRAGIDMLIRNGRPFGVVDSALVYWTLFDFSQLDLHALNNGTTNIVLLAVVGMLDLPIYVPTLGSSVSPLA